MKTMTLTLALMGLLAAGCTAEANTGSTNAKHIADDFDIFDFELTADELARIDALERNQRFASY